MSDPRYSLRKACPVAPTTVAPKKLPRMRRARATVTALEEAAEHILRHERLGAFNANRIADQAGVNIASFYRYFPNKDALLFHVVRRTWERQLAQLAPVLNRAGQDREATLKKFIQRTFLIEAKDADLMRSMRAALLDLRGVKEFQELVASQQKRVHFFLDRTLGNDGSGDRAFFVEFVARLIASAAERAAADGSTRAAIVQQADLLHAMLVNHLDVRER